MKFRILGTLLVLVVLGVVFMLTQDPNSGSPNVNQPIAAPSDTGGLQPLKIN